ncbi:hydrolase [Capsulimonas corticalis]|uniref:Hydrolase n=1 Tax=Capsulimonas corticalis TaxID=2219043 RepID=A0A402D3N3_9BACT|nr:HAD-IA family hydrolase [Capsulimonas corticalis]BDI31865.1 hydrolase [Capsulimonas corticalis]
MTNHKSPIRAIFFDVGDTLVFDNPSQIDRVHIAATACGLDFERARMDAAFRHVEDYALERYVLGETQDDPQVARRCMDILWERFGAAALDDDQWIQLQQAYAAVPYVRELREEIPSLLRALKSEGFQIGVVSDWTIDLETLLTEMGVREHLDALAVSDIVGCTKPDPRIFQEALTQAGVAPEETIHIGDFYELDVVGARAAGMQAALFDWRGRAPNADCPRFTTFAQMLSFVRELYEPNRA